MTNNLIKSAALTGLTGSGATLWHSRFDFDLVQFFSILSFVRFLIRNLGFIWFRSNFVRFSFGFRLNFVRIQNLFALRLLHQPAKPTSNPVPFGAFEPALSLFLVCFEFVSGSVCIRLYKRLSFNRLFKKAVSN